jgi:outer membrane receptor protein involved in Fe transport
MAYVRIATGYRGGGPQNWIDAAVPISPEVEEETLVNYEIGLKGSLLDQRLWFTTGAFYSPYEGFQLDMNQPYPEGVDIPVTDADPLLDYIANVDGTEIWGAEVEFTFTPVERWSLSGSYIYMDSSLGENASVTRGDPDPIRETWYVLWWPPVGHDGTDIPGDVLVLSDVPRDPITNEFLTEDPITGEPIAPLTRQESLERSIEANLPCKGRTGSGIQWPCWGQLETVMPTDKSGNRLAMQPNHKWSLTAAYTVPVPNLGRPSLDLGNLQLVTTYSYTGKRHPYIANLDAHEMQGYGELNIRASWWSPTARWSATVYVANVLDDINLVSYTPGSTAGEQPNTQPDSTAMLSNPRRLGLTLRYRFGS